MNINEIISLSKTGWSSGYSDIWVQNSGKFDANAAKKLPGNNPYYYTVKNLNEYGDREKLIVIWYNENPIAKLNVTRENGYTIPVKNAYSNPTIAVLNKYQGQNLAKSLYGIVLLPPPIGLGANLISDSAQTPGGRRNWVSLSRIPGVEVTGLVKLNKSENDHRLLDDLFGKMGGVYLGSTENSVYYEYPVEVDNNQMRNLIKKSKIKTYHPGNMPSDYIQTWLIARYVR